jgi:hypothetical protein
MDKQALNQMGRNHFAQGKQTTPHDCREVDAAIFAVVRGSDRPAKMYALLRGAFNKGWEQAHLEATEALA